MKRGIDVAKWNTINDYSAVKKAGVQFAIVKVINANNNPDSLLYKHTEGFKGAGIPCDMGYTYSYANTEAKAIAAANAFVKYAKEVNINYMWLDLEDACMKELGSKLVSIINTYKKIAENNEMNFGIYTYASYYNSYIKPYISKLKGIKFWIARYPSASEMKISDSVPSTKNLPAGIDISGWQYTSRGVVNGVEGYIDFDEWYVDSTVSGNAVVSAESNPYTEPTTNCTIGTKGNDANWVLYYLWIFGKFTTNGQPDSSLINGIYSKETALIVKDVQKILGLKGKNIDGIVGKKTRALFKKTLMQ
jgi:GH25 family lysozyme M1 (1,4-beta-N-acetylmuramidase)